MSIHSCCEKYLSLLHEQGFDEGVRASKRDLASYHNEAVQSFVNAESYDTSLVSALSTCGSEEKTLCFWYAYCLARHKIETSYEYKAAEDILICCSELIHTQLLICADTDTEQQLLAVLDRWIQVFIANAQIDRSIYNSIPDLLQSAAGTLSAQIFHLQQLAQSATLDERVKTLYTQYIEEQISAYSIYADTLLNISHAYLLRWEDITTFQHALNATRPLFQDASAKLKALKSEDATIVRSDLMAHQPILERFNYLRQASHGVLEIDHATVEINYFAAIDHDKLTLFSQCVDQHFESSNKIPYLDLSQLGGLEGICEEMTDIWSGLASADYVKKYQWQLPDVTLQFRDKSDLIHFDVSLHYYRMGIFCINLHCHATDFNVSEIRHLLSLGAPFALDEHIAGYNDKRYLFMRDIADEVFEHVNLLINKQLHRPATDNTLHWESKENWFITLDINEISERFDNNRQAVSLHNISQHPSFSGIALPLKEVRVGIDNWVNSPSVHTEDNIAPLRYASNEFIFAQRNSAVLGLLQQPMWVKEQAKESLLVSAIITNLLLISNKQLSLCAKDLLHQHHSNGQPLTLKQLETKIDRLAMYEDRLSTMLETIKLGTIVTYPDHGKLMRGIFEQMDFEQLRSNTNAVLNSIKQKHEHLAEELSLRYEREREKSEKRRNYIIAGAALVISVGAIYDFYKIFDVDINAQKEITIVIVCAIMFVLLALWFWQSKNERD